MFESILLGRCRSCGNAPRAVNDAGLCAACEFVGIVTEVFPATESYTPAEGPMAGITVLDMSRVNLFGK